MERRNQIYRFALTSALVMGLAACGSQSANQSAAQSGHSEVAECSVSLPESSSALEVQRAIDAVLNGSLDPCNGAVDLSGTSAEFVRIDAQHPDVRILFRIVRLRGQYLP